MTSGQQPLFEARTSAKPASTAAPVPAPLWLQRMSLIILVIFCVSIGMVLASLPWTPRLWDHNGWLVAHPGLMRILTTGWVRGLVSGFGILDVWIGISEALHYENRGR